MNYGHKLIIKPGTEVQLKGFETDWHGKHQSHKDAEKEIEKHLEKLDQLQYLLYAENKNSLLIVLQGLDAAGKDGVIRHVMSGMNPQSCKVASFKQPTPLEKAHDFLWRVHPHAPGNGEVVIFNRSHYEDVLITRVHNGVSKDECSGRYKLINHFEKLLVDENETTILKFFLHISKEEQLDRFGKRLKDPTRQWKISDGDYREREYWKAYTEAYEELLNATSTKDAPWYIIPSDYKWFRNLAILQIITCALEDLKMKTPTPTVDIEEIRKQYHGDLREQNLTS